jgi:hypothetical protein
MTTMRSLVLAAMSLFCVQAASAQVTCTAPLKPMLDVELLLGRTGSEAKWRRFLAQEVTPRFPDGLTAYETTGQWRDPATGKIGRERSRVLRIIVPLDPPVQDKLGAVVGAYKSQFKQKSVGIVTRQACVTFGG